MQCTVWEHGTGAGADEFRRKILDGTTKNNCRRCWVSQKYCATGEGMDKRCQWPNVVVPLGYAARLTTEGISIIDELGFEGRDDNGYAAWLRKRHREEVWGQVFTNAMVIAIRLVLRADK